MNKISEFLRANQNAVVVSDFLANQFPVGFRNPIFRELQNRDSIKSRIGIEIVGFYITKLFFIRVDQNFFHRSNMNGIGGFLRKCRHDIKNVGPTSIGSGRPRIHDHLIGCINVLIGYIETGTKKRLLYIKSSFLFFAKPICNPFTVISRNGCFGNPFAVISRNGCFGNPFTDIRNLFFESFVHDKISFHNQCNIFTQKSQYGGV